jgi:hypothetical protein
MGAVDADTQDLGVGGAKARQERFDAGNLLASGRSPVERVEEQQDVLPIPEVGQRDRAAELILELEVRSFHTFCDHDLLSSSTWTNRLRS